MGLTASQITSLTIVYSTVYSDADQRKHQRSASLAFVRGIHRGPVNSPHKWPVTRKMFPFDDVIMSNLSPFSIYGWARSHVFHHWQRTCSAVDRKRDLMRAYNMNTFIQGSLRRKCRQIWWHFHHWVHRKLEFWQLPVQSVKKYHQNDNISVSVIRSGFISRHYIDVIMGTMASQITSLAIEFPA